jgi:Zn-dependent peptidase ImmA (M78 family)
MPKIKQAQNLAYALLDEHGVEQPPVDVIGLAEAEGIHVVFRDLPDDVSGMLVRSEEDTVIGVNAKHHENRQRFTLAHEIAHHKLHAAHPTVYVDGMMVHFRGEEYRGAESIEIEANAFAAALLMPEDYLRDDLRSKSFDMYDEAAVRRLAQRYQVSVQALTIRLMELDLLHGLPAQSSRK